MSYHLIKKIMKQG